MNSFNVHSVGSILIFISQLEKLRPERLDSLPKATQLEVVEWGFEPRIGHRTVLVKCLRSSVDGEQYKNTTNRILNQELVEFREAPNSPGLDLWVGSKLLCLLV